MSNARNFQLTINEATMEHYEEIKEYLLEKGPNYFISCIEENKREKLHMHIYVQYPSCQRLSTQKTRGAHIEACKGSPQANKAYIEKIKTTFGIDNVYEEIGNMRFATIKSDLAISLMEKELGEISKSDFKIWKEIKNIKSFTKKEVYKPNVEIIYVWGDSCVGKTKKVYDLLEEDEKFDRVKYCNGFWQGVNQYDPVKTCWYDEFRDSQMPASEFISFIDYYKNQMNIKFCPAWVNQYEKIFITSIQDPHEIYKNLPQETRTQWLRRMKIIHKEKIL